MLLFQEVYPVCPRLSALYRTRSPSAQEAHLNIIKTKETFKKLHLTASLKGNVTGPTRCKEIYCLVVERYDHALNEAHTQNTILNKYCVALIEESNISQKFMTKQQMNKKKEAQKMVVLFIQNKAHQSNIIKLKSKMNNTKSQFIPNSC